MEKKLRCNKAAGLPCPFEEAAGNLAARFMAAYSSADSGYQLDKELVRNRIGNLILDALVKNPALTAEEFVSGIRLPEIFMDKAAVMYLTELAGEEGASDYFYFAYHFFAAYVFSYIYHHPYYVKTLDKGEVICVLYSQVYRALKDCAAKKANFSFKILNLMFQAAVFELNGIGKFPFTLHRKNMEQYFRFRALIKSGGYSMENAETVADMLSVSVVKVKSYWRLSVLEGSEALLQALHSANPESVSGGTEEAGFADVEVLEIRDRLFSSEKDKNIFDSLIGNGDGRFSGKEIKRLNTTRYHINQVKEAVREKLTFV